MTADPYRFDLPDVTWQEILLLPVLLVLSLPYLWWTARRERGAR